MIDSITYRWEFQLLRDAGRYRRSGPLGLRQAPHDVSLNSPHGSALLVDASRARVAFAIGRSVGNAVVRNRIRRRLRAVLQAADDRGDLAPGRYLFVVSPEATTLSFVELQQHVHRLIGSAA